VPSHPCEELLHDPLAFSHRPLSLRCFPTPDSLPFLGFLGNTRSSNFEPIGRLGRENLLFYFSRKIWTQVHCAVFPNRAGIFRPEKSRKNTCGSIQSRVRARVFGQICSRVCSQTDRKGLSPTEFLGLTLLGEQHSGFTPLWGAASWPLVFSHTVPSLIDSCLHFSPLEKHHGLPTHVSNCFADPCFFSHTHSLCGVSQPPNSATQKSCMPAHSLLRYKEARVRYKTGIAFKVFP
jgi:hypothetical protein